jgi:hypothetical protein
MSSESRSLPLEGLAVTVPPKRSLIGTTVLAAIDATVIFRNARSAA